MAGKAGKYKLIEQFLADGITHMFGNPGTVEEGFLDVLKDYPAMKYILTLQETVAVMMADGYARASQKPTLIQVHSTPGVGNAVGALYQAYRGHSPLVVIGGIAGMNYINMDAQMAGDVVAMMAPVTKYATLVTDSQSLLRTVRRAIKIAATPPMGPVYLCLPMDVLDQVNNEDVRPTSIPSTRVKPEEDTLKQSAQILLNASKPVIFVGDGVAYSGATAELTRVAELIGAEVYTADSGDYIMDTEHPLYQGSTGHMFGSNSLPITQKGDANLIVGTYMLPEVFPSLEDIFAPKAKVIHYDLNAYEIAKNHRVDLGVVCDPKLSLAALADELSAMITPEQKEVIRKRIDEIAQAKKKNTEAQLQADKKAKESGQLTMAVFVEALSKKMPADAVVFDEALTNSPAVQRYIPSKHPGSYFVTRGGSLGVGIPGAMGVKLLHPEKAVVGFTGDGGSMYTIQALWTAVKYNINAKFVVCNNRLYHILEQNIDQYWKEQNITPHAYPTCFDLSLPPLHFDEIAKAFGIDAIRVQQADEIASAIEQMFAVDKPFLIDLVL